MNTRGELHLQSDSEVKIFPLETPRFTIGRGTENSLCLPHGVVSRLHAEIIRTPTFPQDACEVAVDLTRQMLAALKDDPQELAKKHLHRQAYGEPLGRHPLGEEETLARIGRDQIVEHWQRHFAAPRMLVAVAGAVDPSGVAEMFERHFERFGAGAVTRAALLGHDPGFSVPLLPD